MPLKWIAERFADGELDLRVQPAPGPSPIRTQWQRPPECQK